jgi:hypothetical protein
VTFTLSPTSLCSAPITIEDIVENDENQENQHAFGLTTSTIESEEKEPQKPPDITVFTEKEAEQKADIQIDLKEARELSAALEYKTRLKVKEAHDAKITNSRVQIGDYVLAKPNTLPKGTNRKTTRLREGPFVVEWIRDTVAGIRDIFKPNKVVERPIVNLYRFLPGEDYSGFTIDKILDQGVSAEGDDLFFVSYKDKPESYNAWISKDDMASQPNLVTEWHKKKLSSSGGGKKDKKKTIQIHKNSDKVKVDEIIGHRIEGKLYLFKIRESGSKTIKEITRQEFADLNILKEYNQIHQLGIRIPKPKTKRSY